MILFLDFETRSRADLTVVGGHRYADDPTSEVVCLAAVLEDGSRAWVWSPHPGPLGYLGDPPGIDLLEESTGSEELPASLLAVIRDPATVLCAHNAEGFDRLVWQGLGWPEPAGGWLDSLPRARRAGLPGRLDALTKFLFGIGKDKAGRKIMLSLSKPTPMSRAAVDAAVKAAKRVLRGEPPGPGEASLRMLCKGDLEGFVAAPPYGAEILRDPSADQLTEVVRYCLLDVALLRKAWLAEALGEPHPDDPVLAEDTEINRRGVPVDLELVDALLAEADKTSADAGRRAAEATEGAVTEATLRSTQELRAWLAKHKVDVPNAKADTVRAVLAERAAASPMAAVSDPVGVVLNARLDVARVAAGKLRALKARTCRDGRLRGALAYHQAHTGRWAGRGVQPQNLPRPAKGMRPDLVEALLGELPAALDPLPSPLPAAWVGAAIRQCFAAPKGRSLVVLDYSQIEARALLWLAGDEEGLEVYRSGRDAYCEAAAQLYGEPIKKEDPRRQTGKVAVLACLAEGTPVLTPTGFKNIEQVGVDDKVWDGVEWVSHRGLVYRGERECLQLEGVWLTPDHEVLTETGWTPAGFLVGRRFRSPGTRSDGGPWWRSSSSTPAGSPGSGAGAFAGTKAFRRSTTCDRESRLAAIGARSSCRSRRGKQWTAGRRLSPISGCAGSGRAGLAPRWPAATTPATGNIATTAPGGSTSTTSGSLTLPHSSLTCGVCEAIPGSDSPSTGSTTTWATSLGIYASLIRPSKCATPAAIAAGGISLPARSAGQSSASVASSHGSVESGAQVGRRIFRTYDLRLAGPRNRYQAAGLIVHNCGFGAGPDAVERFAVKSEIDLAAAGTTALAVVEAWRSAHPKIAGWPVGRTWTDELGRERQVRKGGWWKQLEKGAREAIETQGTCGPWTHDGRDLYYVLPSGRPLRYRQAGVALVEKGGKDREAIVYFNAQRGAITPTYSGKLCENLTQAYCRDILAIAIVNLSQHPDRKVVLHTHDEVVIECAEDDAPATLAWAKEIMETTPAWAEGLPIKAEGHHGRRYAK